jgi:hypothetical protein
MDLLDADRRRVIKSIIDNQPISRFDPDKLVTLAHLQRLGHPCRFNVGGLIGNPRPMQMLTEFECRAVERGHLVVGLYQHVGDAEPVERRQ